MGTSVAIIDVGINNMLSVTSAFEYCGAEVSLIKNEKDLFRAERLVLPGVGAFKDGIEQLAAFGLIEGIKKVAAKGTPLLGICLGMQMLFDSSLEFGFTPGLGLIPGDVIPVPPRDLKGNNIKIPHVGWSSLLPGRDGDMWNGSILERVQEKAYMYFVHSFMVTPESDDHILAETLYCDQKIVAAVKKDNISACQFHPEKSGEMGLSIIDTFLKES